MNAHWMFYVTEIKSYLLPALIYTSSVKQVKLSPVPNSAVSCLCFWVPARGYTAETAQMMSAWSIVGPSIQSETTLIFSKPMADKINRENIAKSVCLGVPKEWNYKDC